jgi:acid phosphatase type 7
MDSSHDGAAGRRGAPSLRRWLATIGAALAALALATLLGANSRSARAGAAEGVPGTPPAGGLAAPAAIPSALPSPNDPVVAAAGDIACDPANVNFYGALGNPTAEACKMMATSDLLGGIPNLAAVLALGDHQYEAGTYEAFMQSFEPTWGRFKQLIRPTIGNHEARTLGGAPYFQYFGAAAGVPGEGWYSYDVGSWHIIVLNGNCPGPGGCKFGGTQAEWLRSDLRDNPVLCTMAYWHQPRFSSGSHGNVPIYDAFWRELWAAGVEVVINGHDHNYERFAPQTPDAIADLVGGIREFVVGTGGSGLSGISRVRPNSEVRNAGTFGVLALTLHPGSYDWRFIPEPGKTFTDAGSGACHGPNWWFPPGW